MSIKISKKIFVPSKGNINNFTINNNKLCFIVRNNFIYPIEKNYNVKIENSFSLNKNNVIIIKLKIPKFFYSLDYSFELDNFIQNMMAGLNIKSSNGNFNFLLSTNDKTIVINDYCGWMNIDLKYFINTNIYDICDISYSLCFDPFKVKVIKSNCSRNITTIPLDIENNLTLVNCDLSVNDINDIEVKNGDEITPIVSSSFDIESYNWCSPNNFIINSEKLLIDDNIVSGIYTLKVTDIYGCVVEKSFELTKKEDCEDIIATYNFTYKDLKVKVNGIVINITHPTDTEIDYEYNLNDGEWMTYNSIISYSSNVVNSLKIRYTDDTNCEYIVQFDVNNLLS